MLSITLLLALILESDFRTSSCSLRSSCPRCAEQHPVVQLNNAIVESVSRNPALSPSGTPRVDGPSARATPGTAGVGAEQVEKKKRWLQGLMTRQVLSTVNYCYVPPTVVVLVVEVPYWCR